ncbi:hypothetical protein [Pantoea ananatis]|uniref:hypothetical protein n=1 Tax=Pantoea ananas TaxID=553 RepID=UPI001B3100B4|nr:hypothetical protein [Pantoea ananatis]
MATQENENKSQNGNKEERFLEYKHLGAITFVLLLAAISFLYMGNTKTFTDANKDTILFFETASAALAVITFTLDRFNFIDKLPSFFRYFSNIITLSFFLITVPHLFYVSASEANPSSAIVWVIGIFMLLILASMFFYALSLINENKVIKNLILALMLTSLTGWGAYESEKEGVTQKITSAISNFFDNRWLGGL